MCRPLPLWSAIGLGHEGGALAGGARGRLDAALEQHALVRGQHHVVDMAEIDLELSGRELAQGTLDRQLLRLAVALDQLEERLLVLHPLRREHLGLARAAVEAVGARHQRRAMLAACRVDQVELELKRRHRPQARGRRTSQPDVRRAGGSRRRRRCRPASAMPLSIWAPPGRHGTGRTVLGSRRQTPVGVALLPDQPALRHVGTRRVDRIDGGGEEGLAVDGATHGSRPGGACRAARPRDRVAGRLPNR